MGNQANGPVLEELKKQTLWLRVLGIQAVKTEIASFTKTEKKIYEMSDEKATTRSIASRADISHVTVANYWRRWASMGLVTPSEKYKGRFKKIISLKELGLI